MDWEGGSEGERDRESCLMLLAAVLAGGRSAGIYNRSPQGAFRGESGWGGGRAHPGWLGPLIGGGRLD
jgi:hypothetical protein